MRVGIILTWDNAIDPELWEWCAPGVTLHMTRVPPPDVLENDTDDSFFSGRPELMAAATSTLAYIEPEVVAFACTSGSFVDGAEGERQSREAIEAAGVPVGLTTSGAVVEALRAIGARRVAVGTPYDERCSRLLQDFLDAAGFEVVSLEFAPPRSGEKLTDYPEDDVVTLAGRAFRADADAMFLSCTALPTRHVLGSLIERYGIPVISSVQATMWAALAPAGTYRPHGPNDPLAALVPAAHHVDLAG